MKEKNKKKIEWIIGGFFIILFCLLIFYVIPSLDSFNEETDVCLEYPCLWIEDDFCVISDSGFITMSTPLDYVECTDWRDKTICELDPNAEGCVCDEYNYDKDYIDLKRLFENLLEEPCYSRKETCEWVDEEARRKIEYYTNLIEKTKVCIKAHEPNECEIEDVNFIWDCPPTYTETIVTQTVEDNEWRMVDSKDLGEPCVIESIINDSGRFEAIINCTNEFGWDTDVWTVTPPPWKINTDPIVDGLNKVTYEDCTCRPKTNLEKLKDKLKEFDCEKILLDLNEDCLFNCKHNYYSEQDETIKDYYIFKGCKI